VPVFSRSKCKTGARRRLSKVHRRRLIDAAGRPVSFARWIIRAGRSRCDDDSARGQLNAIGQTEPGDAAVRDNQIVASP